MRYILLILGVLGLFGGFFAITSLRPGNEDVRYALIVQAGIVFLAVGMATIDIVEAIRSKRD